MSIYIVIYVVIYTYYYGENNVHTLIRFTDSNALTNLSNIIETYYLTL